VVKKAMKGLEGVKDASVSFKEKRADVLYDPDRVTVEDMIRAISRVGFSGKRIGGEGGGG
jgi:copper chaperone CopZ